MPNKRSRIFILTAMLLWGQGIPYSFASASKDGLTATEKARLEREPKINKRINIYAAASKRSQLIVKGIIRSGEFKDFSSQLLSWKEVLAASLADIEKNVDRKKMSKELIRYEIHLRRALADLQDRRLMVPLEHHRFMDAWLEEADNVRKKLVDILFHRPPAQDDNHE